MKKNKIKLGIAIFIVVTLTSISIMHFWGYTTRLSPYHPPLSWQEIYSVLPKIMIAAFFSALIGIFVLHVAEQDKKKTDENVQKRLKETGKNKEKNEQ